MKKGDELKEVLKHIERSVQMKAKEAGAPLYYIKNGKRIRQEPSGEKFVQIIDSDGNPADFRL
ncbi:hypothetical protein [Paenibacillus tianmuensis]|uniref:hypothetical protein n=1 Tax=Paenibacillus tianmuensis TaxID=624147 RepID=UPI000ADBAB94|nr:hypothetical protein [Paenibacillus tianmuensis]